MARMSIEERAQAVGIMGAGTPIRQVCYPSLLKLQSVLLFVIYCKILTEICFFYQSKWVFFQVARLFNR